MRRASKFVSLAAMVVVVLVSMFSALALSQTKADAATLPAKTSDYINVSRPVVSPLAVELPQMPLVLPASHAATMPADVNVAGTATCAAAGAAVGSIVPGLGTVIGAVGGTVVGALHGCDAITKAAGKVIDFVKHPLDAIAQRAGIEIGKAIKWAGGGVIDLVTGDPASCHGTGSTSQACEDRIEKDYFPPSASTSAGADDGKDFWIPKAVVSSPNFEREYEKYVLIALLLLVPMVIAAALQAVITGKPVVMLRSVFLHLPACMFGIALTPWLVKWLMIIIDNFSYFILKDTATDMGSFFSSANVVEAAGATAAVDLLPLIIVGLIFCFACMLIWFILSMREASVGLLTMFMPIAFAASVWPALGKWSLRGIKLVMAAIISKMFIVGAVSLGIGVFSSAVGHTSSNATDSTFSFSHLIFGSTIFFIAAFSPHLVMKFFDEIGEALNAAGGTGAVSRGLSVSGNSNGTGQMLGRLTGKEQGLVGTSARGGGGGGGGGGMGSGSMASLAGSLAAMTARNDPNADAGSVGKAAATASRTTAGSTGTDDARIAAAAARTMPDASGDPVRSGQNTFNSAADAAQTRAQQELGPGASTDAVAQRAGQYMGAAALQDGATTGQAADLASATVTGLGGSSGAASAAAKATRQSTKPHKTRSQKVFSGVTFSPIGAARRKVKGD